MAGQMVAKYIDYLKNLNALSKLDMVLMGDDGTLTADFIKYSKHAMVQRRRNDSREKFIGYVLSLAGRDSDFQEISSPLLVGEYYFYAAAVMLEQEKYLLCVGPFYIEELISAMIESDLPRYSFGDIKSAVRLFRGIPQETAGPTRAPGRKEASVRQELDMREIHRLNPTAQIRYNAKHEKVIRTAIANGSMEMIRTYTDEYNYMPAVHMMAGEETLLRVKYGIASANSVYCRAAEDGGASSVVVRSICADFAQQIKDAGDVEQLINLRKKAALIYCRKVREARQQDFSLYVKRCIRWVEENLTEKVTLSRAADHCGISYDYLSKLIKKDCGCSFSQLVHRLRCQAAVCYLQHDLELWEVAEKCGYKNSSQFCRSFQNVYGVSPERWKKEHGS